MKILMKPAVAAIACLFLFASVRAIQSEDAEKDKGKNAPAEKKETKKASGPRLPRFYAQLDLTKEQRDNVLAVQKKYGPQIVEDQKKLEGLRQKQNDESMAVLSKEQQQKLIEIANKAKERRSNKEAKGSESPLKSKGVAAEIREKISETKRTSKARLPRYYAQLELTTEQRDKVLSVQEKYGPQVVEVQKKIQELRQKQSDESMAVLTKEQQIKLVELVNISKGNRSNKKEAKGSESALKSKDVGAAIREKISESKEAEKAEKPAEKTDK